MCGSTTFIYLASQSPRRRQLLDQIAVRHELLLASAQEDAEALEAPLPNERPRDYVLRVTQLKLAAACSRWAERQLPVAPILCADTTVALGERILGKPCDAVEAKQMLSLLAGSDHQVMTAVALAYLHEGQWQQAARLSVSQVRFAPMTEIEIERYVDSGEPMGKAGSYAVQGLASRYIVEIQGSYSGIMGLPLYETACLLNQVPAMPITGDGALG